jgi:hypothetical protein
MGYELLFWMAAIQIALLVALDLVGSFNEFRRQDRAQREVQRRLDQYIADTEEALTKVDEERRRG